jgi:hypothetical protein
MLGLEAMSGFSLSQRASSQVLRLLRDANADRCVDMDADRCIDANRYPDIDAGLHADAFLGAN